MANREALRELQNRLSGRLQAARVQGITASWLAVEAGGTRYLLPLSHAGEIFAWSAPVRVPYTQPWFTGVANLRGGLYGVIDLAAFVSGEAPRPRPEAAYADSRLVAFNPVLETNAALLIDRLSGLRSPDAFAEATQPDAQAPAYMGTLYTDTQGQTWQELNLQALAQNNQFLTIGA